MNDSFTSDFYIISFLSFYRPEQLGSIIHVPSRVQDAENALQAFAPFHMYTCDMNVEFGVVLDLLKNLRQYLADGALTVYFTFACIKPSLKFLASLCFVLFLFF